MPGNLPAGAKAARPAEEAAGGIAPGRPGRRPGAPVGGMVTVARRRAEPQCSIFGPADDGLRVLAAGTEHVGSGGDSDVESTSRGLGPNWQDQLRRRQGDMRAARAVTPQSRSARLASAVRQANLQVREVLSQKKPFQLQLLLRMT